MYLVSQGARLLGSLTKGVGTAPVVISVPVTDRHGRDTTAKPQLQEIDGGTRAGTSTNPVLGPATNGPPTGILSRGVHARGPGRTCLLYTSDAADE